MRFIMSIILIGISVTVFLMFANPMYTDINTLRAQTASYSEALDNAQALAEERDKLTTKDNLIDPEDKIKLHKFLPNNIDNIRLILEIEQIAGSRGMILKDVKYNPVEKSDGKEKTTAVRSESAEVANKSYGAWDLEFSTSGPYDSFLDFIADLEKNLRMVDISSITFSSNITPAKDTTIKPVGGVTVVPSVESYKYDIKIKTYWLKN